jgi:hypothetical protein
MCKQWLSINTDNDLQSAEVVYVEDIASAKNCYSQ